METVEKKTADLTVTDCKMKLCKFTKGTKQYLQDKKLESTTCKVPKGGIMEVGKYLQDQVYLLTLPSPPLN